MLKKAVRKWFEQLIQRVPQLSMDAEIRIQGTFKIFWKEIQGILTNKTYLIADCGECLKRLKVHFMEIAIDAGFDLEGCAQLCQQTQGPNLEIIFRLKYNKNDLIKNIFTN